MKIYLLLIAFIFLSFTDLLDAAITPANLVAFDTLAGNLQTHFKTSLASASTVIRGASINLFYSLMVIQTVLIGIKLIFGAKEMNEILAELVRLLLLGGFILWLINDGYSLKVLESIANSFEQIATSISSSFHFNQITGELNNLYKAVSGEVTFWTWVTKGSKFIMMALVVGAVSTVVIGYALVIALKNYIFGIIAIVISPLLFAASVLEYTRSWALSIILLIIKYGMKFMLIIMLADVVIGLIGDLFKKDLNNAALMTILTLGFLLLDLMRESENLVESLFSGSHHGSNTKMKMGIK